MAPDQTVEATGENAREQEDLTPRQQSLFRYMAKTNSYLDEHAIVECPKVFVAWLDDRLARFASVTFAKLDIYTTKEGQEVAREAYLLPLDKTKKGIVGFGRRKKYLPESMMYIIGGDNPAAMHRDLHRLKDRNRILGIFYIGLKQDGEEIGHVYVNGSAGR